MLSKQIGFPKSSRESSFPSFFPSLHGQFFDVFGVYSIQHAPGQGGPPPGMAYGGGGIQTGGKVPWQNYHDIYLKEMGIPYTHTFMPYILVWLKMSTLKGRSRCPGSVAVLLTCFSFGGWLNNNSTGYQP